MISIRKKPHANLYHVSHAKAGSTWIENILKSTFERRCYKRFGGNHSAYRFKTGTVYPAIFATYQEFEALDRAVESPHFFVVRDIRDALVSLYFSMRYSHTTKGFPNIETFREAVVDMTDQEGVEFTFEKHSNRLLKIQSSWINSDSTIIRYEDLIDDCESVLVNVFTELKVDYRAHKLIKAIANESFENQFKRPLGSEDIQSHGRTGLPGDWKRFQSPALDKTIDSKFNHVLNQCNYSL